MNRVIATSLSVVFLTFTIAAGDGQQVQQVQTIQVAPPMGAEGLQLPGRGQMKTGTGRIRGRLVTIDTGAPVRRAQVRISSPDIMPKTAVTDGDGRYEFRDLPASKFSINASKPGFVSMNFGQKRPFESGTTIELGEGQALDKADIAMPRGSAISGRIVDELGEPVADVMVTAMRAGWVNGRRRLQPAGRAAQTNDLGQYRIYGLAPGEYYVSATSRMPGGPEFMMMEDMVGAVSAARTVVTTMAGGGGTSAPGPSASEPRTGYAPTYYPGTANGAEAQRIQLAAGQEMPSADFSLLPVRLARVSGTVVGSNGQPVEGSMLQLMPRSGLEAGALISPLAGSARSDREGRFTFNNVTPGEYTLQARGLRIVMPGGGDTMTFTTRIGGGDGETESGSVPVSVTGDDVANVMVLTSKGASVSGRVVFEGGARPSGPVRITAAAVDEGIPMPAAGAAVTAEGTFELRGLVGNRVIRPAALPGGWILKSVTLNGTDITDSGLNVKANQPVTGVEVTLTQRRTEINGTATADNRPTSDYTVVVFSTDQDKWSLPMTRHVSSTRPNQEGRFQIQNLPPGSYHVVAVTYIAQGDWNDPEVLARLKTAATEVTLGEGETQTVTLKVASQ